MKTHRALFALFAAAVSMAALVLSPSLADACPCPGGGGGDPSAQVERRLQHLTQRLGLDARQVTRIRAVIEESAERREAVRSLPRGSEERRRARADLQTWTHARIRALLTPAQQAAFDELRAERRRHHPDGRGRRGGRGSPSDA